MKTADWSIKAAWHDGARWWRIGQQTVPASGRPMAARRGAAQALARIPRGARVRRLRLEVALAGDGNRS